MIDDMETNANEAKPAFATEEQEVGSPCEKVHLGHFREDRVRGGILLSVVQEEAEEAEASLEKEAAAAAANKVGGGNVSLILEEVEAGQSSPEEAKKVPELPLQGGWVY